MAQDQARLIAWIAIAAAALAFGIVGGYSASSLEIGWDESIDHDIAVALRHHPFVGGDLAVDPTQMRLPMYVNAFVFTLTGSDSLRTMRLVSILAGMLTVLAAGGLAMTLFNTRTAVMTAWLLALSPYFLAYGRVAMTEGDVFAACLMTLTIWSFIAYARKPHPIQWSLTTILLALAVGAKLYCLLLVPILAILNSEHRSGRGVSPPRRDELRRLDRTLRIGVAIVLTGFIVLACARQFSIPTLPTAQTIGMWLWFATLLVWFYALLIVVAQTVLPHDRWAAFRRMIALAVLSFFVLMPVHLLNPGIVHDVVRRATHWDHRLPFSLWREHLRLYAGILLLKLTLPLGIIAAFSLPVAALSERFQPRWRTPIVAVALYVVAMCALPIRQSFYLMPIYPMIAILIAALLDRIGHGLYEWSKFAGRLGAVAIPILFLHLAVTTWSAYPYFHLHGYGWVGNRWLGAESRGSTNVVQTPSDGVESLIEWCNANARVGQRVVSYLWEDGIIDRHVSANPHFLLIRRGVTEGSEIPPPPPIEQADYVLLHINNKLGYAGHAPDWPSGPMFDELYAPVGVVRRGPLDVAWVYGRKNR